MIFSRLFPEAYTSMDYDKLIKEALHEYQLNGVLHLGACSPCEQLKIYEGSSLKEIILVEGNPELAKSFDDIHMSISSRYTFLNAVVSDTDDEIVDFHIIYSKCSRNKGTSSLYKRKKNKGFVTKKVVKLPTVTVDKLLERNGIDAESIDFLVMDIQGAELLALKGAKKILSHVKVIITELMWKSAYEMQPTANEIESFLMTQGFKKIRTLRVNSSWGDAMFVKIGENHE